MTTPPLSRRERQILDLVYAAGEATASEVRDGMDDAPSYSAVRATLATMVRKGHLEVGRDGVRYVYRPAVPVSQARRTALDRLVTAFFGGSAAQAATALVERERLDPAELDALEAAIARAREAGR